MKQKLWIDTDMGNDDIMAITMLMQSNTFVIKGISTVNGVSRANIGFLRMNDLLNFYKKEIPLFQGFKNALIEKNAKFPIQDRIRAEKLILLSALKIQKKRIQINALTDTIMFENTKETTLVALGPLTNIASVIQKKGNNFAKRIKRIVLMGGGIYNGNVPPFYKAEYNIWLDPEAADIVFNSNIPITMIGIDATSYIPSNNSLREKIGKTQPTSKTGNVIKEIALANTSDFDYYYDPLAVSVLLNSNVIKERIQGNISIQLSGENRGQTVFTKNKSGNVEVVTKPNQKIFYELLISSIKNGKK